MREQAAADISAGCRMLYQHHARTMQSSLPCSNSMKQYRSKKHMVNTCTVVYEKGATCHNTDLGFACLRCRLNFTRCWHPKLLQ
jgi:hypothetical protein